MLDLYNTISSEEKSPVEGVLDRYQSMRTTQSPPLATYQETAFLNDADMVMSFVNLGKFLEIILLYGCFFVRNCEMFLLDRWITGNLTVRDWIKGEQVFGTSKT